MTEHQPSDVVSISFIRFLSKESLISNKEEQDALEAIMPYHHKRVWIENGLLFCGLALILASIIYFFAFNWAALEDWHKLLAVQIGLALPVLAALYNNVDSLAGKLSSLCASALVGVCLAVYGQVYQTGADAYQLFLGWSLLILPWVVLTRFAALWCLWLVVANIAILFYWEQQAATLSGPQWIYLILALFNLGILVLKELFHSKPWLQSAWVRLFLVLSILLYLNIFSCLAIFEHWKDFPWGAMALVMGLYACIAIVYTKVRTDLKVFSLWMISFCIVVETWLARLILDESWGTLSMLTMFLLTCALFGAATMVLVKVHQRLG